MKKNLRLLFVFVALFSVGVSMTFGRQNASSTLVPTYFVNESFTSATTYPTGWSAGTALYAASAGVSWTSPATDQLNVAGSGSGNRGYTINYTTSGSETNVYVSFDWSITSQVVGQKNSIGLILHGSGATTADPKNILGLYNCGSGGFFYCWNLEKDSATYLTGGTFNRASAVNVAGTSTRNAGSNTNFALATSTWYNIKAKLNFTTHVIDSLIITKKSDNSKAVFVNLSFINSTANDIAEISCFATKSSNAGNGGNSGFNYSIDNFQTYKLIDAATSTVTINYLDPSNIAFKTANIITNQTVGSTYTALSSDKATYTDGSFYYIYDAASTISDNVVVAADGSSVINLKFKKVAVSAGTYTWTGFINSNLNDADANFTTDGTNNLAYQKNNPLLFSSTAINKVVVVNQNIDLGSGNINMTADGYSFSGSGIISGTGSLNINLPVTSTVSLGVINNMTGSTQIAGGLVTVTKAGTLGSSLIFSGPSTLTSDYAIPTSTFNASSQIQSTAPTSIAGLSSIAGAKASISSSFVTLNSAYAFSIAPTGTFAGELELNGTGTDTKFGLTAVAADYLANAKVTLKGTTYLFVDAAQTAATTINIGTLTGESGARLGWGKTSTAANDITWSVGGLNENSTYAGTITNIGGYQGSGNFYTGSKTNFTKVGTGKLIFSGTANTHNGNFAVNAGELSVTGAIGNATSKDTVAVGAKLSGTGSIGGPTVVNGTLEGRLNFGSSLTLAGTTNLTVDGFNATQYDSISVAGAVTYGGILNVTINAAAPAYGTYLKLIKASSVLGTFGTVNLPAGYIFDHSSGNLVYGFYTNINQFGNSKLSIYPTLTHDLVNIVGANSSTIELVNLIGQTVKNINSTSDKTIINMNGLSTGTYFVKVRSMDGSVNVQKVLYQK